MTTLKQALIEANIELPITQPRRSSKTERVQRKILEELRHRKASQGMCPSVRRRDGRSKNGTRVRKPANREMWAKRG